MSQIKLHSIFDNAYMTKERAKHIVLPPTPKGRDILTHNVGDTVTASGKGSLKTGCTFIVEQTDIVHGFARYYGAGMWHRQGDINV